MGKAPISLWHTTITKSHQTYLVSMLQLGVVARVAWAVTVCGARTSRQQTLQVLP
jgi:hypothetical protein